jgi:hypothetical protein
MKIFLIIISTCFLQHSYGQEKKYFVVDAETKKPIAYATIKVLHTTKGQIASKNGEFTIDIHPNDSVLISSVGYEDTIFIGSKISNEIRLVSRTNILNPVTVRTKKVVDKFLIGNGVAFIDKTIKCNYTPGVDKDCLPWGAGGGAEFVEPMELPDSLRSYRLTKLYLPLKKYNCFQPMFLNIYENDPVTGKPGNLFFRKPLSLNPEEYKKGKVILDLREDDIYFSDMRRFHIGLSWDRNYTGTYCASVLILMRTVKGITYSRTLVAENYNWFLLKGGTLRLKESSERYHTIFAAEIEALQD